MHDRESRFAGSWRGYSRSLQVFSAPNYVDQVGNKGAYVRSLVCLMPAGTLTLHQQIRMDAAGDLKYFQFEAQTHPPLKPMAYAMGGLASLMM